MDLRYLFSLAELDRRAFNVDPASYIEELLLLGKTAEAKRYARKGSALLITERYALEVARLFDKFGQSSEGMLLFSLAQPEMVTPNSIVLDYREKIDNSTYWLLQEWVTSAAIFQECDIVLQKVKNLTAINLSEEHELLTEPELFQNLLLRDLAIALMYQEKWPEMEYVLAEYDLTKDLQKNYFFQILHIAVRSNIGRNRDKAREYLKRLLSNFSPAEANDSQRILIADLIITLEKDKDLATNWVVGIEQPLIKSSEDLGIESSLDVFQPLIKLNKVLNLIGKGVAVTDTVPTGTYTSDDWVIGEFQRMLCLITQMFCEGIESKTILNFSQRIQPIIQFYNREAPAYNTYWHRLTKLKTDYFDFLIRTVAPSGAENVNELIAALEADIVHHAKYWSSDQIRGIADTLLRNHIEVERALALLSTLESNMLIEKDISGRISECMLQAKSYLLANDKAKAEEWIKRGITESIGVGYRKDYQFNTWLDWLPQNIKRHPETAAQEICWFLSHLHHLKESTEGRAANSAARKLLGITLDWNLAAGIIQMKWMLDNGLIRFEDAIGTFMEILLTKDIGQAEYELLIGIYSDLYLFLADNPDDTLLVLFLQKGESLYGEEFDVNWVQAIYRIIITKTLDEKRPSLLITLENFLLNKGKKVRELVPVFAIPEEPDHQQSGSSSSSNTLVITPDHERISHEEVMARVNTYEEFRDLLNQEDKVNSSYNWTEIFRKIELLIDLARIQEIEGIIIGTRKSIELLVLLSEKAQELGDSLLAEKLVDEGIAQSTANGWVTFYDGGTRIKTFTALQKIKGNEGTKKAFDVFGYDLLQNDLAINYIESLDEILPVIAPGFDEDMVWSQLFSYLQRLMSTSIPSDNLPDLTPQEKSLYDNIIDTLNYFSAYPVTLVYTAAQKLLAGQLNGKMPYPLQVVTSLQQDNDTGAELFTSLLLLSQEYGNDLSAFYPQLESLATSSNYMIRTEAVHLLKLNDQRVPKISKQTLSPFFQMDFDSSDSDIITLSMEGHIHPIGQIIKLITPLDRDLRILSRITGITEKTLIYRTYMVLRKAGIPSDWQAADDGGFNKHLEQIRLRYGYAKPRAIAVKRAIARVVSELVDAGVLDEESAIQFFGPRDKGTDLLPTARKPGFISPLGEKKFMLDAKKWLDDIKNNPRLNETMLKNDGRNVIGEYTVLTSLDWGKAQQIFMSQIKGSQEPNRKWFIFEGVINGQTKDYYDLKNTGKSIIIIREETHANFSALSNWIAINPVLARYIGWHPLPGRLFAWADAEGNCLVESIYWMDGNIRMQPPHLYSKAGEGWYILATDQALAEIREVKPQLYQEKFIYRSTEYGSNSEQHATILKLDC